MRNTAIGLAISSVLCVTSFISPVSAQVTPSANKLEIDPKVEKELARRLCVVYRQKGNTNEFVLTVYNWIGQYDKGLLEYRLTAEYLAGQGYSNIYSTFLSDYGQLAKRYATTLQIELTRSFLAKHFPNCVRKRK